MYFIHKGGGGGNNDSCGLGRRNEKKMLKNKTGHYKDVVDKYCPHV